MKHYIQSTKKAFIGKGILDITRKDKSSVIITLDDGSKILMSVDGDCCSHSIFYEIVLPEELKGKPILDVDEGCQYDSKDEGAESEQIALEKAKLVDPDFYADCLKIWDVIFKTSQGDIRVRHINSSNGYYDGSTLFESIE